jgi:parvulin-like peptidyl-prolyl isomerase
VFIPVAAGGATEPVRRTLATMARDVAAGRTQFESLPKHVAGAQYLDLGWLTDAKLNKAAHDAVAGLPEGQISPPLCTANGCTLIKLLATRPAGPPPLPEVRDRLVQLLREQKQNALAQAYENSLLAKEPVRINEIQLSHLPSP